MLIGAVADDFTGATDLATAMHSRGLRAAVVIEHMPVSPGLIDGLDAVVVALKSRTAPVERAVAESTAAMTRLIEWGAERFYFKYCSTFDSTDAGNIGPVLDAFQRMLSADRAVIVPAFPDNGRTVYNGHLFVGSDLLEHSSMRHHPLTPMTRSRISELLRPQTGAAITEIPLSVVRAGVEELRITLAAAPSGYLVVDAIDNDDLRTIALATSGHRLVSGGAGLALGLGDGPTRARESFPAFGGGRLVVCGSASAATRGQIAHASASHPTRKVNVGAALLDPGAERAAIAAWVRGLAPEQVPVVYSVGELTDVLPANSASAEDAAQVVEQVLSSLVSDLVADGTIDQVVVAGGETSGAVVRELGIGVLTIGPQLAPGVCWSSATTADGRDVALVLKSGNFGAIDLFSSAWTVLS